MDHHHLYHWSPTTQTLFFNQNTLVKNAEKPPLLSLIYTEKGILKHGIYEKICHHTFKDCTDHSLAIIAMPITNRHHIFLLGITNHLLIHKDTLFFEKQLESFIRKTPNTLLYPLSPFFEHKKSIML